MHCQNIINHIKNTKNDARSIKIMVMDKNNCSENNKTLHIWITQTRTFYTKMFKR